MPDRFLPTIEGYDPEAQREVHTFAASLDDQLRRLKSAISPLEAKHFEWQVAPGHNTVGMLLVHLAYVEVSWIHGPGQGCLEREAVSARTIEILALDPVTDGMPCPPDGGHPDWLRGKDRAWYEDLLDRARAVIHAVMKGWGDPSLAEVIEDQGFRIDRRWILYHVLEHLAAHFGQVLLVLHLQRDAGLLDSEAAGKV